MFKYNITTGQMLNPDSTELAIGYSGGNCGKNPEGKNNPDMQNVKNIGPIPCGDYTIFKPAFADPVKGPLCMRLIPEVGNNMFNRGGFMIHGDTNPAGNASEGCIVLPHNARLIIANSNDNDLQVIK